MNKIFKKKFFLDSGGKIVPPIPSKNILMSGSKGSLPGKHIIIDMIGTTKLSDITKIDSTLKNAALLANANVVNSLYHTFNNSEGVTGILLLEESHISIHTWPEESYVAIDVFMCGNSNPYECIQPLVDLFKPSMFEITDIVRDHILESK